MPINPYDKYKEQSVMTMTHGEMLVKLYEEAAKQMKLGQRCITESDLVAANNALQKAQRILSYLKETLDFKYEVSNSLASLYDFFNSQIMMANIRKDPSLLDSIIPMVEDLKDTFLEGEKLARMSKQPAESRVG